MHEEPRRILAQLLILYGPDLHSDPRRTEALLRDYCPQHAREIFVLVNAQKQRVAADLLATPAWMPQAAVQAQLTGRLQQNLALTEEAARWAVLTWAEALRVAPSPPDRVWVWLRQHTPSPQALGASRQFVRRLPNLWGRHFGQSGVQWGWPFSDLSRVDLNRVAALRRWGRWAGALLRPPLLTPLVVLLSAWLTAGGASQLAPTTAGAASPPWLLGAYPLPRPAWVNAGPLTIRSGPTLEQAPVGVLGAGDAILVTAYSSDGEWAQIQQPQAGWVSLRFLRHRIDDGGGALGGFDVILGLQGGRAGDGPANIRAGPGLAYAIVGRLAPHEDVVVIAVYAHGGWKEIISPMHGWVHDELLVIAKETDTDKEIDIDP